MNCAGRVLLKAEFINISRICHSYLHFLTVNPFSKTDFEFRHLLARLLIPRIAFLSPLRCHTVTMILCMAIDKGNPNLSISIPRELGDDVRFRLRTSFIGLF